jgi:hypothetical protein
MGFAIMGIPQHSYNRIPDVIRWPEYFGYADDLDFISKNRKESEALVALAIEVFKDFNLKVNPTKTVFTQITSEKNQRGCIKNTKKLGSYLDDEEDIQKRKTLSNNILFKLEKIWRNHNIKTGFKHFIYRSYVESVFLYNCGTWATNKTLDKKLDAFHRRQLRWVINVRYPKIITNEHLYQTTGESELSKRIANRRKALLRHILRRDNAASNTFYCITALSQNYKKKRGCRNLLKTYETDIEKIPRLRTCALASKF